MPITVSAIVGAIAATAGAASDARNKKLKRDYEQALAGLELEEKKRLAKELEEANNLEQKRAILAETLGKATQTRIQSIEQKKLETQKTLNKLVLIGGIGAVVLIVGLIIVYQKRKK